MATPLQPLNSTKQCSFSEVCHDYSLHHERSKTNWLFEIDTSIKGSSMVSLFWKFLLCSTWRKHKSTNSLEIHGVGLMDLGSFGLFEAHSKQSFCPNYQVSCNRSPIQRNGSDKPRWSRSFRGHFTPWHCWPSSGGCWLELRPCILGSQRSRIQCTSCKLYTFYGLDGSSPSKPGHFIRSRISRLLFWGCFRAGQGDRRGVWGIHWWFWPSWP